MRRLYLAHNHDSDYWLKHGNWPPDDFIMFREVGKPLENGEILTLERFVEWEDKYVALVQEFFAALGKETFYIASWATEFEEYVSDVLANVSPDFRKRMAEIIKTERATRDDLDRLVRACVKGKFWCKIVTSPVTYFAMTWDLYSEFSFDDDDLDFNQLDHHGLTVSDLTETLSVDPETFEPIDIPPGFFDND